MGIGKFMRHTALVVDLFVVSTSLYLELMFDPVSYTHLTLPTICSV